MGESVASAPIRTAAEAGAWLESLINHERQPDFRYERLDLGPIRALLGRLGHPERSLSVVHVAGSKGKGSTCLLIEAVLRAAGERVGTFTSPHLERWTERFRIDGREVGGTALARAVERVRPHVEAVRTERPAEAPTFFDATTAAAFVLFAEARVDRVVLEVGLGGRLDSTNVVDPAVTVITHIELEHTDKLGDSLGAIAREKAGILKPGVPCVVGALAPEADAVVRERASEVGAPLQRLGRDFFVEREDHERGGGEDAERTAARPGLGRRFAYRESDFTVDGLVLGVLGAHQVDNAGLALAAVRRLGVHAPEVLAAGARAALARAVLPARLERIGDRPTVIVDAAHTPASARSLAIVLGELPAARRHVLLSISRDKDPRAILDALAPATDELWLTRSEPVRSLDPAALAAVAKERLPGVIVHAIEDPGEAVRAAHAALAPDDLLCCAGSVYLAGAARRTLREMGLLPAPPP
jgi:dihydrofolate synthase/folylpolyglutamate synthase